MTKFVTAAMAAAFVATAAVPALAQQGGRGATAPEAPGVTNPQGEVSDAMVNKVGAALRQTVSIRQKYAERAQSTKSPQDQQSLNEQAQSEMVQAISDQGLTVQQYNQVIQLAQANPTLKQRLISAAQAGG